MTNRIELGSKRILQPGRWLWLRSILWAVALLVLVIGPSALLAGATYAAGALLTGTPLEKIMEVPGPVHLLAMLVLALAVLGTYCGWVRLGEDRNAAELALRPALRELIAGIALGAAMMTAVVLLMQGAGWATITPATMTDAWRAVAMSIESGVAEEVALRLIVFRLLWRAFGPWAALLFSALLFGGLHIMNPGSSAFAAVCIAIEAGVMLAAFYIVTGRLWLSIGVHAGWNFFQGWVFGAPVSGTDFFEGGPLDFRPAAGVPDILSGGAFGPEASLIALVVGTAVGGSTLWIAWRRGQLVASDEAVTVADQAPAPVLEARQPE